MASIMRDGRLTKVADSVKPDAKRRVSLPKGLLRDGLTYHIYVNPAGQIVLDPQITISASEAWLFENQTALASVDKGVIESSHGRLTDRGSFAKFTKDAL
jgi:hypothetical protein